jgi:hypothetical protein
MNHSTDPRQLPIQAALNVWESNVSRTRKLWDALTQEQLMREITPGKNRGVYLLGHLLAYHDAYGGLLGITERAYPELDVVFINNPDKAGLPMPDQPTMKRQWDRVHQRLADHMAQLSPDNWFGPHTAVTQEEFARQPHRSKFNVLLNRTNHLSYHLGQLRLLT